MSPVQGGFLPLAMPAGIDFTTPRYLEVLQPQISAFSAPVVFIDMENLMCLWCYYSIQKMSPQQPREEKKS